MTRLELWSGLTTVVVVLAVLAMISGVVLPALTVEVVGSLMGVFLAISISEVIRLWTDRTKGLSLKKSLLEEIRFICTLSKDGTTGYSFDCPIWTSAKNAGMIELLGEKTLIAFSRVYLMIDWLNQNRRGLDMAEVLGKEDFRQRLIGHQQFVTRRLLELVDTLFPMPTKKTD